MNGFETMKDFSFLFLESQEKKILYHLSPVKLDENILKPRVPSTAGAFFFNKDNQMVSEDDKNITKKVEEDNKTGRISFSGSITGCLNAVPFGKIRYIWFVYKANNPKQEYIKTPSFREVPDSEVSNEVWYLKPIKVDFVGMIFSQKYENPSRTSSHGMKKYKFDYKYIKNYEPPYFKYEVIEKYGLQKYKMMTGENEKNPTLGQQTHKWRCISGIELVHKEPTKEEFERIWKNWNVMTKEMKDISDKKCKEIYGRTNKENYEYFKKMY